MWEQAGSVDKTTTENVISSAQRAKDNSVVLRSPIRFVARAKSMVGFGMLGHPWQRQSKAIMPCHPARL
ncbi:hypothetical protein EV356DRAFT_286566 [Viridothelium virens]|uniref:Uncharacterized protein n=1 Tax=Viridothelium virens TaxID=1048519 RepID=A0A6A6H0V6_VIRVR|nr:hypothetical protein EV356DRAFT_286566 [Viridothelium virens]